VTQTSHFLTTEGGTTEMGDVDGIHGLLLPGGQLPQ
jgi:hypothetical protein